MAVNPIPEGFAGVTPYLVVKGAAAAIDFYARVFGATEIMRLKAPNDSVAHAEMKIGGGAIMLAEEFPDYGTRSPLAIGGTAVTMLVYFPDVDAVFERAVAAGVTVTKPLRDEFYGDRSATFTDPFGHSWTIATHKEDMTPEQMAERMPAF